MNPFRPATLVVALSLAFAGQVSFGADSAAAPVAAAPTPGTELGLDKSGMDPAVRPQDDLLDRKSVV